MFTVNENTTVIGLSELRSKWKQIRSAMKTSRIKVSRRNQPEAVLISIEEYEAMEELFDRLEDYALALKAHERERGSRRKDFVPLEEVIRKFS